MLHDTSNDTYTSCLKVNRFGNVTIITLTKILSCYSHAETVMAQVYMVLQIWQSEVAKWLSQHLHENFVRLTFPRDEVVV